MPSNEMPFHNVPPFIGQSAAASVLSNLPFFCLVERKIYYNSNHILRASNSRIAPSSPLADISYEAMCPSCLLADKWKCLRHYVNFAAENSKRGELETAKSTRGTRYLAMSLPSFFS